MRFYHTCFCAFRWLGFWGCVRYLHYNDVIMGAMTSQITSLTIVYSIVYSGADQRKHQSSMSPVFVRGIPAQSASNAEIVSIWWRHHSRTHRSMFKWVECTCSSQMSVTWQFKVNTYQQPFIWFVYPIVWHHNGTTIETTITMALWKVVTYIIGLFFLSTQHKSRKQLQSLRWKRNLYFILLSHFSQKTTWMSNHMHCKVCDEITCPFPNFHDVEILGIDK